MKSIKIIAMPLLFVSTFVYTNDSSLDQQLEILEENSTHVNRSVMFQPVEELPIAFVPGQTEAAFNNTIPSGRPGGLLVADGSGGYSGVVTPSADGQLLVGSAAGSSAFATLNSANGTLTYSGGPNTLSIDLEDNTKTVAVNGWNGSIVESPKINVISGGSTITCEVQRNGGGDLTVVFNDAFYNWDTTPADTVTLTAGTDTVPVLNYIYFLESTKALTASTVGFPNAEHAPIATILCQSASSVQVDGPYKVHAWTDHVTDSTNNTGHLGHLNFWIRQQAATWLNGVDFNLTITTASNPDDVIFETITSGEVLQLHPQFFPVFPAISTSVGPDMYVVNDSTTPYKKITNINEVREDSTGSTIGNNRYFSLVVWGTVSESDSFNGSTNPSKLFINLPSGTYNNANKLRRDQNKFTNFAIPEEFRGTGFLIAQLLLRYRTANSGTWNIIDTLNLRGLFPAVAAGGVSSGDIEFLDSGFKIVDNLDTTKMVTFELNDVTTGKTRTLTVPDRDGTIALAELHVTSINDTDSAYAVQANDQFISCDVSGGVLTVQLPDTTDTGRVIHIKDRLGDAATNNITLTTVGGAVTIDGATSVVLNTNYQGITVLFDGTRYLVTN